MASVNFADIITFTRASGGGRFNAQGVYEWLPANEPRIDYNPVTGECRGLLIEEQRTNLENYSGQIDSTTYNTTDFPATLTANAATSPSGSVNASLLSPTAISHIHAVFGRAVAAFTSGTSYTKSVFAKDSGGRFLQLTFPSAMFGTSQYANFDLQTGAIGATVGGTASIIPAGNGWYRCSFTATATSSGTTSTGLLGLIPSATSERLPSFVGTPANGIYIWGAQLEAGAFPTSYIPTPATFTGRASTGTYFDADGVLKIAAAGEARYTHAYVDGKWVSAGLLLEESRTNLLTYSSDFANAVWTKQFVSIEDNAATSPDGAVNAAKMVTAAGTTRGVYLIPSGYALNTDHTLSVFAKAAGRNTLRLEWNGSGTVEFDLISGTKLGGPATAGIAHVGNGWYRCWTVGQRSSTGQAVVIRFGAAEQTGGDGTSGIYIWGAQLEAGSSPTSYIPTTTAQVTRAADTSTSSQVTRAADIASVNELSPWYNASEGTLFAKWSLIYPQTGVTNQHVAVFSNGGFNNYVGIRRQDDGTIRGQSIVSGVVQANISAGMAKPTVMRAAMRIKANAFAISLDGAAPGTDILGTVPVVNKLDVGYMSAAGQYLNGHIESIRYFPRALTNTELQEITA